MLKGSFGGGRECGLLGGVKWEVDEERQDFSFGMARLWGEEFWGGWCECGMRKEDCGWSERMRLLERLLEIEGEGVEVDACERIGGGTGGGGEVKREMERKEGDIVLVLVLPSHRAVSV